MANSDGELVVELSVMHQTSSSAIAQITASVLAHVPVRCW